VSVPPDLRLPDEVRRTDVEAASGPLAALVGEPPPRAPAAPPALLVPGYTGSKEDFLPVLARLARAGHRSVAIDLRGQHESTGPDDRAAYTIDALAKDVAAVLDGLGGPAHLVGHSFGGLVTRRAVIGGIRPLTLTLLGSGPAALGGRRAEITELMRPVLADGGTAAIADISAALDRDDPRVAGLPGEVHHFLRLRWLNSSPTGLLVMGEELLAAEDEVDELAAAGVPTMVVHGEADDAWPPDVQRAMAERLGARYRVVAGAVHSPACEAPDGCAQELLDFWAPSPDHPSPDTVT
jgi:pimeloyl-ACP methyl ester carboxylesterase